MGPKKSQLSNKGSSMHSVRSGPSGPPVSMVSNKSGHTAPPVAPAQPVSSLPICSAAQRCLRCPQRPEGKTAHAVRHMQSLCAAHDSCTCHITLSELGMRAQADWRQRLISNTHTQRILRVAVVFGVGAILSDGILTPSISGELQRSAHVLHLTQAVSS